MGVAFVHTPHLVFSFMQLGFIQYRHSTDCRLIASTSPPPHPIRPG